MDDWQGSQQISECHGLIDKLVEDEDEGDNKQVPE